MLTATWLFYERLSHMVCLIVVTLLTASPAGEVKRLVAEAQRAYGNKRYVEAARLLEEAKGLDASGRIVFNLARAYERAGEVDRAIANYEEYLEHPDAEFQALRRARAALTTLYRTRPPKAQPAPEEPPPSPPPATVAVVEPPPPPPVVDVPRVESPKLEPAAAPQVIAPTAPPSPRVGRTVGWVVTAAGVVGAGVGLGLGGWASGTAAQARASVDPVQKPALRDAALQQATAADITLATGGAVIVTGVITLLVEQLVQRP